MVNYGSPALETTATKPVTDAELFESCEALSNAAVELVDAGASVERVAACMDNVSLALTAIQNGGVTDQMLKTFNSCGELSGLLGQENLTPAGLESFSDSQIKKVTDTYAAGLEGKLAEYWNKFIAWLKNMWAKLVNWFKNIFINRAKYIKALEPVKSMTHFDPNATVNCKGLWTEKNNAKWVEIDKNLNAALDEFEKNRTDPDEFRQAAEQVAAQIAAWEKKGKSTDGEKLIDKPAADRKVSTMFPNMNSFKATVAQYIIDSKKDIFQSVTKKVDTNFKRLIDDAGKAGNLEGDAAKDAKELINAKRVYLSAILKGIRESNKLNQVMGAELYAIYKAANHEPKTKK